MSDIILNDFLLMEIAQTNNYLKYIYIYIVFNNLPLMETLLRSSA